MQLKQVNSKEKAMGTTTQKGNKRGKNRAREHSYRSCPTKDKHNMKAKGEMLQKIEKEEGVVTNIASCID
jgi:hypothetical protein